MRPAERQAALAIPTILLVGAGIAWAGSQGGVLVGGFPLFALCAAVAFGVNWLVFVHANATKSDHFFDLTGSLTYISLIVAALVLTAPPDPRAVLLGALVVLWALRLGSFLYARIRHTEGDPRFERIKRSFIRFFMAWTLQGLWVLLTLACALAAMTSASPKPLGIFAAVGTALWLAGFAIEVAADNQKKKFRADPANDGKFIAEGLWRWSQHPNYFGEILLWVGVAVIAWPVLSGWQNATLISPVFVYILLTRISGISMLDARALKRWGDDEAYRTYRASTPALWLRPPRG